MFGMRSTPDSEMIRSLERQVQIDAEVIEKKNQTVSALYAALDRYVRSRAHDLEHGEDCPKRYCGDDECDGTVEDEETPPSRIPCIECEGEPCDCGLAKIHIAYGMAREALALARGGTSPEPEHDPNAGGGNLDG